MPMCFRMRHTTWVSLRAVAVTARRWCLPASGRKASRLGDRLLPQGCRPAPGARGRAHPLSVCRDTCRCLDAVVGCDGAGSSSSPPPTGPAPSTRRSSGPVASTTKSTSVRLTPFGARLSSPNSLRTCPSLITSCPKAWPAQTDGFSGAQIEYLADEKNGTRRSPPLLGEDGPRVAGGFGAG